MATMLRVLPTVALLFCPGWLFAANPNENQIKALKAEKDQLKSQEKQQLKQIDEQFKTILARLGAEEGQLKAERGRVEAEEREAIKRVDERYHYIIHHLEPKQIRAEIEQAIVILRRVHSILEIGDFDYGGHRHAAQEATKNAEHQLRRMLEHDTFEERVKAGRDLHAAHVDIVKALEYSLRKYGLGDVNSKNEPEPRIAANRQLVECIPAIENAHHLLMSIDHEVKDVDREKRELHEKFELEKRKIHEQAHVRIEKIDARLHEIEHLRHDPKAVEAQKHAEQDKVKAQFAAKIKQIDEQIKQLEKKK
jgi:hypothetical protein